MNSKFGVTVAALFALTGLVPNASADETDEASGKLEEPRELGPEARKEALEGMSEEERAALRESVQARRDEQLSSDDTVACGTCHIPATGIVHRDI